MREPRGVRRPARRALRMVLVVAAVATMTVSGPWLAQSHPVRGAPDIVVFLTDDQRWDSLGGMPALQRELVERGRRYDDAMVPTSLCCPSRASILSGKFAHTTGVWGNHWPLGGWRRVVEQGVEDDSIAVALQSHGYRTALIGKYFNGFSNHAPPGYTPPGWDQFSAFRTPGHSGSYYDFRLAGSRRYYGDSSYSTDVLASRASQFIRETSQEEPLFLYLATWAPHGPFTPPQRYADTAPRRPEPRGPVVVKDRRRLQPTWLRRQQPVRAAAMAAIEDGQARSLLAVDDAVDRVVGALRDSGRLHNTLFLFMSDNGLLRGEHGLTGKHLPYDAATRVPMVLRWDARVPAGTVDRRLALNVDVAATLSAASGVPMSTDGLDLLGPVSRTGFPVEAIGKRSLGRPPYCGWRTHRYLFVRYANGEEELYDYRVDPRERVNRAGFPAYADTVRQLRARARAACVPAPPGFSWTAQLRGPAADRPG